MGYMKICTYWKESQAWGIEGAKVGFFGELPLHAVGVSATHQSHRTCKHDVESALGAGFVSYLLHHRLLGI